MPICLNCGKEIKRGGNFCEDCRRLGDEKQLIELTNTSTGSGYEARKRWGTGSIVIVIAIMLLLVGGLGFGLLTMIPTNQKFQVEAQAAICRKNLTNLETNIKGYIETTHQYPTAGPIGRKHPLIVDGYTEAPPHCPTTGHEYILIVKDGVCTAVCDSKLKGHDLSGSRKGSSTPAPSNPGPSGTVPSSTTPSNPVPGIPAPPTQVPLPGDPATDSTVPGNTVPGNTVPDTSSPVTSVPLPH